MRLEEARMANGSDEAGWKNMQEAMEALGAAFDELYSDLREKAPEADARESRAMKWLREAEKRRYPPLLLALAWYKRRGVSVDEATAADWCRKSAEMGDIPAQRTLGECYLSGEGVPRDCWKAMQWFEKAAEQGDAVSQRVMGQSCLSGQGVWENPAKAVRWFKKAAEQGDAEAQYFLGVCCHSGIGTARDPAAARMWMEKAADGGSGKAKDFLKKHI